MAGADIAMGPRSCCIGGPELVTGADLNFFERHQGGGGGGAPPGAGGVDARQGQIINKRIRGTERATAQGQTEDSWGENNVLR